MLQKYTLARSRRRAYACANGHSDKPKQAHSTDATFELIFHCPQLSIFEHSHARKHAPELTDTAPKSVSLNETARNWPGFGQCSGEPVRHYRQCAGETLAPIYSARDLLVFFSKFNSSLVWRASERSEPTMTPPTTSSAIRRRRPGAAVCVWCARAQATPPSPSRPPSTGLICRRHCRLQPAAAAAAAALFLLRNNG